MPATARKQPVRLGSVNDQAYLNALPSAVLAINSDLCIIYLNPAAEMLTTTGRQQAIGKPVNSLLSVSQLDGLMRRAFADAAQISLYEQEVSLTQGKINATLHLTPIMLDNLTVEQVLLTVDKTEGLNTLAASEWKKDTTHAAGVMAAMLAHEVKNPLAGIRGAAQLLKDELAQEHQPLAELICRETDRIRDLLAQVEIFTSGKPAASHPVNIHEVLQYVLSVAMTGFAKHVQLKEVYDPSLPQVMANRDLLVQLFLNLVKNATEAMSDHSDEAVLTVTTTYRSGYRIRQGNALVSLPIMVSIEDNGPGIDETVRDRLFEPFASSKEEGRGLGLAVVAKIASDLGIVVELDKEARKGAKFNVMLASDKS